MQMAISGHSNEQSCVMQQKTVTGALDGMLRHYFSVFMNTPSQSRQNFPVNQRRADEYVKLKVCSIAVILVL